MKSAQEQWKVLEKNLRTGKISLWLGLRVILLEILYVIS